MKRISIVAIISIAALTGACSKKVAVATPQSPAATPSAPREEPAKPIATVTRPAATPNQQTAPPKQAAGLSPAERQALNESLARLEDAMFDYDKSTIRPDAAKTLADDVTVIRTTLARFPGEKITIEGHCDQRGSDEYNMALGERRAQASKEFLINMGINASQLATITYGKERPQCTDNSEACYQRNRRAHLVADAR
jgi:peptidoglycan-associated lipoprotein